MNDQNLRVELERVSMRYRRLMVWRTLAMLWLILALAVVTIMFWTPWSAIGGSALPSAVLVALAGATAVTLYFAAARTRLARNPHWIARQIERKFPDLDTRLLAAIEQEPEAGSSMGFLQQMVIDQSLVHAARNGWDQVVPARKLRLAGVAHLAMLFLFAGVACAFVLEVSQHGRLPGGAHTQAAAAIPYQIKVEPGDVQWERGKPLLVKAEFDKSHVPGDVHLLIKDDKGVLQDLRMTRSLDDPIFGLRTDPINQNTTYAIRYGDEQTKEYKISVFEFPTLKQADADLKFPDFTGLPEKKVQDTRTVTAVEGTKATLSFHLNKAVTSATLVPEIHTPATQPDLAGPAGPPAPGAPGARGGRGGARGGLARGGRGGPATPAYDERPQMVPETDDATPLALTADPKDPTLYTVTLDLLHSQTYNLQLVDADQRTNKGPDRMAIHVTQDRPADLRVTLPGRDVAVSPLEELNVKASVWDEYGVKKVGITYSIAGQDPKEAVVAQNVPGKARKDVTGVISLEELNAQPDQLLSYYVWAEDIGPDGKPRRTSSDMYFAEVRPFEVVYRQGEQPAQGEEQQQQRQRQQQQQQGQQGQQSGQQRQQQLAQTEKQIITATWNIQRRETGQTPSTNFVPDVKAVQDSQTDAKSQASDMADNADDERAAAAIADAVKQMDQATQQLASAASGPTIQPLGSALSAEQAAYQDLLRTRSRDNNVIRGQRGQQQGQNQDQQQQLDQLDLANQDNNYQTQQQARQRQQNQDQQQQAEDRQVLSRLRDLAQRQQDLNQQMREQQSALQQARTQQQRDDAQRQLARLRDQEEQQLQDTDELRDRLDQPQNQERMSDARQQLDSTREQIRQAGQDLQQGQVGDAQAAGQRAGEQLNNLRDQVRQQTGNAITDAVNQMRDDARALDDNQRQLNQRLAQLDQGNTDASARTPGLRQADQRGQERQQIAQGLNQQRQQLDQLTNNMRQTIDDAESTEPILTQKLYDTLRAESQQDVGSQLDTSRDLVQQGLTQQAQQSGADAGRNITQLRQGVEQAAQSVLGNDTQALAQARDELDNLTQQLEREMNQNGAPGQQQQANGQRGGQQGQQGQQGQRGGQQGQRGGQQNGQQLAQNGQRGGQQGQQGQQGQEGQQAGGQQGGQQGGRQGGGQPGQQANGQRGGQRGGQQGQRGGQQGQRGGQPGDQQASAQPGQQGQPGQGRQGGGQRGGQPGGQQLAGGQQPGGQQPGGQGRGQQGQPGQRGQLAGGQPGQGQPGLNQPGDAGERQLAGGQQPGQQPGEQAGQQGAGRQGAGRQGGQRGGQPGQAGAQPGEQPRQLANAQQPGDQNGPPNGQQNGVPNGLAGGPGTQPATQPGALAGGGPATQPGENQFAQGGPGAGTQPGDQNGQGGAGTQPSDQQANAGQGGGQFPGRAGQRGGQRGGALAGGQPATQPGENQFAQGGPGAGTQPGDQNPNEQALANGQNPQDAQNPGDAQDQNGQPGQLAQGGQRGGQAGQRGGQRGGQAGQRSGAQARGGQRGGQPNQGGNYQGGNYQGGQVAQGGAYFPLGGPYVNDATTQPGELNPATQPGEFAQATTQPGDANTANAGVITGTGYRQFSDGLRDVQEMVNDPALSEQAAQIRERAQQLRDQFRNHAVPPNWDVVRDTIDGPLVELRDQVAQELLRRQAPTAMVPLDREPVPPDYTEQVKRYYERLGSGK